MKKLIRWLLVLTVFLIPHYSYAAEYLGRNVDNEMFSATAFSYGTGKYYFNNNDGTYSPSCRC